MRALVTGATGLVGHAVARALLDRGHEVRALVRDPARARQLVPPGAVLVAGDLTGGPAALARAFEGSELLFHAGGLPEGWQRDEAIFDHVNRGGTRHALEAARQAGVRRIVYTSTMDVFAAPRGGTLVEGPLDPAPKPTAYERSKVAAQREVDDAVARGAEIVTVNPAAVYGPAPVVTGLNQFAHKLLARQVPLLPPGGMPVVFAEGLASAQLAAAERGRPGEKYLVSDGFMTNAELAAAVASAAGLSRVPPTGPEWLLAPLAGVMAPLARLLGFRPLVSPGELAFVLWQVRIDASKAGRELGFVPTPTAEGWRRTVAWLRAGQAGR
jgi:nucleoside-diphosphate-sugar epimerase